MNIVAEVDGVDPPFMIAVVLVIAMLGTVKDALGMRNAGINDSLVNERNVTYLMPYEKP